MSKTKKCEVTAISKSSAFCRLNWLVFRFKCKKVAAILILNRSFYVVKSFEIYKNSAMNILAILNSEDFRSFSKKSFLPKKTYNRGHPYGYLLIKVIKQGVLKIMASWCTFTFRRQGET